MKIIYTSEMWQKAGIHIWPIMLRELINSRDLIWQLIVRDITVKYRQSILTYIWAILPPLITVLLLTFLLSRRILNIQEPPFPYISFALWNLTLWQLFAGVLNSSTNSLVNAGMLITKVNFPKIAVVIAATGQSLLEFVIRLIVVFPVFIWQGISIHWKFIFLPMISLLVLLFAIGVGFIFSIINLVVRDTSHVVSLALTFCIFLTPVFYPPPTDYPFYLINLLNPLSPLLIAAQDIIAYGSLSSPEGFIFGSIISLTTFLLGWRIFNVVLPKVIERA